MLATISYFVYNIYIRSHSASLKIPKLSARVYVSMCCVVALQALQVESFCSINSINSQTSQEGGMQDQEHGRENRATAAKSKPVEGDTLPAVRRKEGHADCLVGENVTEGIHADVGVPREALNIDSTRGSSPNVGGNRKVVYPAQQGEITIRPCHSHVAMSQSWLYGRATLEETGRCIGAELEVAMLCMQRRLGQVSQDNDALPPSAL